MLHIYFIKEIIYNPEINQSMLAYPFQKQSSFNDPK